MSLFLNKEPGQVYDVSVDVLLPQLRFTPQTAVSATAELSTVMNLFDNDPGTRWDVKVRNAGPNRAIQFTVQFQQTFCLESVQVRCLSYWGVGMNL